MEAGATPEEMVDSAQRMMEAHMRPECSVESALQLQRALKDLNLVEGQFLNCDSISELPGLARRYAEAHELSSAAMNAVRREACIEEVPIEPRRGVTTSG